MSQNAIQYQSPTGPQPRTHSFYFNHVVNQPKANSLRTRPPQPKVLTPPFEIPVSPGLPDLETLALDMDIEPDELGEPDWEMFDSLMNELDEMNTTAEVEATGTIDPRLVMKGAEVSTGPQPSMAIAQSDSAPSLGIKAQSQRKTKPGVTFTDSITPDTFAARKKPHPLSNVRSANSPETPKPTTALPKGQFANARGVGSLTASAPPRAECTAGSGI